MDDPSSRVNTTDNAAQVTTPGVDGDTDMDMELLNQHVLGAGSNPAPQVMSNADQLSFPEAEAETTRSDNSTLQWFNRDLSVIFSEVYEDGWMYNGNGIENQ